MSAQHTPGPWSVNPAAKTEIIATDEALVLARLPSELYAPSSPANASLIAAAPELLAAAIRALPLLQGMTYEPVDDMGAHEALRTAIAKAQGGGQ